MLRTGARRPAVEVAVGTRRIGDRAVSMAVAMAGQEFPTTISGFPEAQSLMILSRIGEVQRRVGKSVADRSEAPAIRQPQSGSHEIRCWREIDSSFQFLSRGCQP